MSSDLEKFLQQAAERLAQKAAGRNTPAGRQATGQAGNQSRSRQSPPLAEIIPAEVVSTPPRVTSLRELGPDPLSEIDTRPELAREINQTDERMLEHMHQVFDHQISHLRAASSTLADTTSRPELNTIPASPTLPVLAMLRNPDTLKAAFIASEIFKRKA